MTESTEAVVLFGAGGFVGRNIVGALHGRVSALYGVTRSGRPVDGCTLTVASDELDSLPRLPKSTVAINVAAYRYDARTFRDDQPAILSHNVALTDRFYRFCCAREIVEVRAAGSVAVYPAAWDVLDDARVLDLNDPPHDGEAAYAWSKRWGEIAADLYRRLAGINTVTFRITNPFGPFDTLDESAAHVATAFVIRALAPGATFQIRGNPDAERDFVFAGDVAAIFRASLAERGRHTAVNLARGETTTIRALAEAAMRAVGRLRPLDVAGRSDAGVSVRRATAARLREVVPSAPPLRPLADGLHETIGWYRRAIAA